jgi:TolA-binding protein
MYRFQSKDEIGFDSRFRLMLSKFPASPLIGDSLYLAGLMEAGMKNYGKSLRLLSRLEKQYPLNHQITAAIFAKGVIYKKMNLPVLAKSVFENVQAKYPGSPEATRAALELRTLK